MALSAAVQRDLSGAAVYAQYACILDPENADAAKLLELCIDELGKNEEEGFDRVRALATQKKWRRAEQEARTLSCQSVRVLNIRACLLAAAKRYTQAADCFAAALGKDRFNRLAAAGLAEIATRRTWLWWIG
jgi:tetratricopeptide (TPR) repeat protein